MPRRFTKDDGEFESEAFSFLNQKSDDDGEGEPDQTELDDPDIGDQVSEDDDDDAPEDISFHASRQSALAQVRSALQQIGSEKEKKKVARKKMDAQFKKQKLRNKLKALKGAASIKERVKSEKLKQLAEAKLPDDILDGIDDHIPAKKKKVDKSRKNKKKVFKDEDDQDALQGTQTHPAGDDFIAFVDSASGVHVAEIKSVEKQTKTLAQTAADFRNNRLYGKHVRRESNKDRMATADKRRQRTR